MRNDVRVARRLLALLAAAVVAFGCSGGANGEVRVSAAASLVEAFTAVGSEFEENNADVTVVLNTGASSALREQVLAGAPVDVFASADLTNMELVVEAGETVSEPRVFARNRLQIAVPSGNPAGVTGLGDFADPGLLIGLCAEAAPCGALARRALAAAGVTPSVDSEEPDARALLTKIGAGELDAGLVYVTDIRAGGGAVESIPMPAEADVVTEYPIVVLGGAGNPAAAGAFVDFVLSDAGRAILASHGFELP